jgi:hypothetical protein
MSLSVVEEWNGLQIELLVVNLAFLEMCKKVGAFFSFFFQGSVAHSTSVALWVVPPFHLVMYGVLYLTGIR